MSNDHPKIVLIGAGSAQFGYSTIGDIAQSEALRNRNTDIVLHDINKETLDKVANNVQNSLIAKTCHSRFPLLLQGRKL